MRAAKTWWLREAWPWLRKNWRWILFPVGLLLFLVSRGRRVAVVDPVADADARAAEEAETRNEETAEARHEAEENVRDVVDAADKKQREMEDNLRHAVATDPEDLEALVEKMKRTGRGTP